jgi:hypothetical protein
MTTKMLLPKPRAMTILDTLQEILDGTDTVDENVAGVEKAAETEDSIEETTEEADEERREESMESSSSLDSEDIVDESTDEDAEVELISLLDDEVPPKLPDPLENTPQ